MHSGLWVQATHSHQSRHVTSSALPLPRLARTLTTLRIGHRCPVDAASPAVAGHMLRPTPGRAVVVVPQVPWPAWLQGLVTPRAVDQARIDLGCPAPAFQVVATVVAALPWAEAAGHHESRRTRRLLVERRVTHSATRTSPVRYSPSLPRSRCPSWTQRRMSWGLTRARRAAWAPVRRASRSTGSHLRVRETPRPSAEAFAGIPVLLAITVNPRSSRVQRDRLSVSDVPRLDSNQHPSVPLARRVRLPLCGTGHVRSQRYGATSRTR